METNPPPPIRIASTEERAWERYRVAIMRYLDDPSEANLRARDEAKEAFATAHLSGSAQ